MSQTDKSARKCNPGIPIIIQSIRVKRSVSFALKFCCRYACRKVAARSGDIYAAYGAGDVFRCNTFKRCGSALNYARKSADYGAAVRDGVGKDIRAVERG